MKAVAVFMLVLCSLAVTHAGIRCELVSGLYNACQIDASVGMVVVTTRSHYAYMLVGNFFYRLSYIKVKLVTVGHTGIWASGSYNQVYRYICGNFRRVRGKFMKQLDAGGKQVMGVSTINKAHCLRAPYAAAINGYNSAAWTPLNYVLKHISCSASGPCWGITTNHRVVCSKRVNPYNCYSTPGKFVGGSLRQVKISTFGVVVGVNKFGKVYRRIGISTTRPHGLAWLYIPTCFATKYVSYDLRRLWVVTTSGLIMKCKY